MTPPAASFCPQWPPKSRPCAGRGWRADNPKGDLQELLQAGGKPTPTYCVVEQAGPAHRPRFVVAVTTPDGVLGKGEGASKNAAETAAARNALAALGGHGPVR